MMLYGRNKGYSEFNLSQPDITYNDEKNEAFLTYHLTEGPQVDFGTVAFDGNNVFTPEELNKQVLFRKGHRYNQKDFDDTKKTLSQGSRSVLETANRFIEKSKNANIDFEEEKDDE